MAIGLRSPPIACIFHGDRGCYYSSHDIQKVLRKHGLKASMSGNAAAREHFLCGPRGKSHSMLKRAPEALQVSGLRRICPWSLASSGLEQCFSSAALRTGNCLPAWRRPAPLAASSMPAAVHQRSAIFGWRQRFTFRQTCLISRSGGIWLSNSGNMGASPVSLPNCGKPDPRCPDQPLQRTRHCRDRPVGLMKTGKGLTCLTH